MGLDEAIKLVLEFKETDPVPFGFIVGGATIVTISYIVVGLINGILSGIRDILGGIKCRIIKVIGVKKKSTRGAQSPKVILDRATSNNLVTPISREARREELGMSPELREEVQAVKKRNIQTDKIT